MAEIMGFGLSHYPGPGVPVEFWPHMLSQWVKLGRVEARSLRRQVALARADARGMGQRRGAKRRARASPPPARRISRACARSSTRSRPISSSSGATISSRTSSATAFPPFSVGIFDKVISRPYGGGKVPFGTTENAWGLPADTELPIRCHYDGAAALCRTLIEEGFDLAYSRTTRHPAGLAHSFNNTVLYLDYERRGFDYPIIPFHVNCYGNQLMTTSASAVGEGSDEISPPAPSPARCFALGRATARFFAQSPWRVALIGSASWSHGSLTPKHGRLYPDLEADRARAEELRSGRFRDWGNLAQSQIDDSRPARDPQLDLPRRRHDRAWPFGRGGRLRRELRVQLGEMFRPLPIAVGAAAASRGRYRRTGDGVIDAPPGGR